MLARLSIPLVALFALMLLAPGCGPPCTKAGICGVDGNGSDIAVCDGDNYVKCEDATRGKVIGCDPKPQEAVCTPNGWAFEPAQPTR